MQIASVLVFVLASAGGPRECVNAPSRVSDTYWDYIEACGCSNVEGPSRASADYERFLKACSRWRERNQAVKGAKPAPSSTETPVGKECMNPPSRVSAVYWDYLDACGCAGVEPPPGASDDYKRFLNACSQWRQKNPGKVGPARPTPSKPSGQ